MVRENQFCQEMTKLVVSESTIVTPAEETPKMNLWISNLDQFVLQYIYIQVVYFYRPSYAARNFFDSKVMKDALSRVLVPFYPVAGRLKVDQNRRLEIDCQGQGALFMTAESDRAIDDYGDFAPRLEFLQLIPTVDVSLAINLNPLLLVQVTYFKCGGVSLGVAIDHHLADASSMIHFINSWSEMARGFDLTLPPIIDRAVLRARDPPQPIFEHTEFQQIRSIPFETPSDEIINSIFKFSFDQIEALKAKTKVDGNTMNFTFYEMIAGHIWKSVCKARGLNDAEDTQVNIPVNGRARLQPALPQGYFGNVVIVVNSMAIVGKLQSNPFLYGSKTIHCDIAQRNSDYLKSFIDYLELQLDINALYGGVELKFPFLQINSWTRFRVYEADFGWGQPIFMGQAYLPFDGICILSPSSLDNDGSTSITISLQAHHMKLFSKYLYDI